MIESSSIENLVNAEIITPVTGSVIKDKVGLQNNPDNTLVCRNCNRKLVTITKVKDKPKTVKYGKKLVTLDKLTFIANCPFCDNQSWEFKIEGAEVIYSGADITIIGDVDIEELSPGFLVRIEVLKNVKNQPK